MKVHGIITGPGNLFGGSVVQLACQGFYTPVPSDIHFFLHVFPS
jgi:hypothetical protein